MITIFNRKKLLTESSAEELARVRLILKNEKIPFEVKTTRSRGIIGNILDVRSFSATHINIPYSERNQHYDFIYHLYVRKKDYASAYRSAYCGNNGK